MAPDFLLIIDIQRAFSPAPDLVERISAVLPKFPNAATIQLYDENRVPFYRQLGWRGLAQDECLVASSYVFIKHGYQLPDCVVEHIRASGARRVLLGGIQADTCVLAAGFKLFDEGLHPTLVSSLCQGSSVDPGMASASLLWRHHFGAVIESIEI